MIHQFLVQFAGCMGTFCGPFLLCDISSRMGEGCCFATCCPGALVALRIKLRVQENIQVGSPTSSLLFCRVGRAFVRSIPFLERIRGITANLNDQRELINFYIITKSMRALWLVNQPWFIVPVNSWKNRASSELLYKSNRPQVSIPTEVKRFFLYLVWFPVSLY